MDLDTQRFIAGRTTVLEQENASEAISLQMAKTKVEEIERRMERNARIVQGLKDLLVQP